MMFCKVFYFCLSAVLIQTITCQCLRNGFNANIAMANALPMANCAYLDNGLAAEFVTDLSNGGRFTVISSSRIPSSGLKVHSDNLAVNGPLAVSGQMPFLGIVALNGAVPADGIGTVLYECGNGRVGITEEVEENAFRNLGFGVSCNGLGYATPTYGYIVL